MHCELVHVFADDGLKLDGALHAPAPEVGTPTNQLQALLVIHGTGSNFYGSRFLNYIAARATQSGTACLLVNTRGHDQITTALVQQSDGSTTSRTIGSAYERVDECRLDLRAWVKLLNERGYQRIGILGHSLGAVKTIYAAAHESLPGVAALIAVSPPRLSYAHLLANAPGPHFANDHANAERLAAEGRPNAIMEVQFPIPYAITAAGYLDKYGREERYNLLNLVDRLTLPTLFTFGSAEVQQSIAFRGFPEALEEKKAAGAKLSTVVIAGGDHHYTGVQGDLMNAVERWLGRKAEGGEGKVEGTE